MHNPGPPAGAPEAKRSKTEAGQRRIEVRWQLDNSTIWWACSDMGPPPRKLGWDDAGMALLDGMTLLRYDAREDLGFDSEDRLVMIMPAGSDLRLLRDMTEDPMDALMQWRPEGSSEEPPPLIALYNPVAVKGRGEADARPAELDEAHCVGEVTHIDERGRYTVRVTVEPIDPSQRERVYRVTGLTHSQLEVLEEDEEGGDDYGGVVGGGTQGLLGAMSDQVAQSAQFQQLQPAQQAAIAEKMAAIRAQMEAKLGALATSAGDQGHLVTEGEMRGVLGEVDLRAAAPGPPSP